VKVSREDVIKNRALILAAASRLFRERGFDGVNVAQIMGAAGLTHGAFYGYFASKDALIAQSMAHILLSQPDGESSVPAEIGLYAAAYLSADHRDAPGDGCPYAALGSELTRSKRAAKRVMTKAVRNRIVSFTRVPGARAGKKRRAAIAAWSAMIGAVTLSRMVDDKQLSDEILEETRAWLKSTGVI
jgi:TetR/AcrR family transcriptional repressor of nem operon